MAEVVRKARHLGLVAVSDEERRSTCKRNHDSEHGNRADLPEGLDDVRQTTNGAPRRRAVLTKMAPIRGRHQPQEQRKVENRVDEDAVRGADRDHDEAADARTDEDSEVTRRRGKTNRARQCRKADDVVKEHLARRDPQDPRAPVNDEEHHRVPHLECVGDKEVAPPCRGHDEEQGSGLDEAPRVEAVVQRTDGDREGQKRQPVGDHGKAAQRGGVEFLKHHPVAHDVLDVVGHHREQERRQIRAVPGKTQGGKRLGSRCSRCRIGSAHHFAKSS